MQPFQPVVSPSASAIAGWMSSANPSLPHAAVAQGPPGLVQPPNTGDFLYLPCFDHSIMLFIIFGLG